MKNTGIDTPATEIAMISRSMRVPRFTAASVPLGNCQCTVPPGVDNPDIMYAVRSGDFVTDAKLRWREAYDRQMRAAVRPLQEAAE